MYSTKDVLEILKISKPTFYKLCKNKGIKPKIVGSHYRYTDFDLERLLSDFGVDTRSQEKKFEGLVNNIWFMLVQYAKSLYGKDAETKLRKIIENQKDSIFVLNTTNFKEIKNESRNK